MKTKIAAAWIAIFAIITVGCGETDKNQFNRTFFPTNHWVVVGQGTNRQVIVETKSTNLAYYLRVHSSIADSLLTNGQPVRVEMTVRWNPMKASVDLISSKAYPAME